MRHIQHRLKSRGFLIILIAIAALFRFYNLNWDGGHFFHSDERNIANAVNKIHFFDQLDPGFYAYGGFMIYLYRASGEVVSYVSQNPMWVEDWAYINVLGRFHSALFSTLMIFPLYFVGKKLFNKQTALLAAVIATYTVTFIQTAHFTITENYLLLALMTLLLLSLTLFDTPKLRWYVLCGLVLGTALATKTAALAFFVIPLMTQVLLLQKKESSYKRIAFSTFLLFIVAGFVFILLSPYSLLEWPKFFESMQYESGVARGTLPVVYTLQFTHTLPYLFQLQQLFWQMGIVFFFSLSGLIIVVWELIRKRNSAYLIFLIFPLVYFLYVGSWHTKFIRYMVPLVPFFILSAAYFLHVLHSTHKRVGSVIIAGTLFITALWAIAFFSIYTKDQTRITASYWMYQHIPRTSLLLKEHWDDGLPVPLSAEYHPGIIQTEELTIYEPDNDKKITYYASKLASADFLVINSKRLYGTLLYLPDKYPITQKYYQLLFSEKLGYKKVAEFSSYPQIFGIEINDDVSEETFQIYDHPKVMIFQNTAHLSERETALLLQGI